VKATDTGGPLKKDYPPPPPAGFDETGKPIEPPDKLKEQIAKQKEFPGGMTPVGVSPVVKSPFGTFEKPKTVRVQSATPKAPPSGATQAPPPKSRH
jgi:hypothetical protein